MPKTIVCLFMFESDSSPGKLYQTLQYEDGSTSCDCKGWTFKRRNTPDGGRSCKHTRMVDAGVATGHAVKVQDYRKPQGMSLPRSRSITPQPELVGQRISRKFNLED